jgi:hypothetical protein
MYPGNNFVICKIFLLFTLGLVGINDYAVDLNKSPWNGMY